MTEICSKEQNKYYCKKCNKEYVFKSSLIKHEQHCNSALHRCRHCNKTFAYASGLSRHLKKCGGGGFKCANCNIVYTHRSSLSRHNKVCTAVKLNNDIERVLNDKFQAQNDLIIQQINDTIKPNVIISNNNYNVNNNINVGNINIFLNKDCKDAINMTDFIMNVPVTIDDLIYTKDNGYVNGIGNLLGKHLETLKPTERPIHCSDKKRLKFYIKDEDEWTNDEKNHFDGNIDTLTERQISHIKKWEEKYPQWYNNQNKTDEYLGILEPLCDKNQHDMKKIKRLISDYVSI